MKIIKKDGHSQLVEYQEKGKTKRVILPRGEDDVNLGIPHGFPFADVLKDKVCKGMAERIEDELHKAGIWTAKDALSNPAGVQGAILSAYAIDYSFILQVAKNHKEV